MSESATTLELPFGEPAEDNDDLVVLSSRPLSSDELDQLNRIEELTDEFADLLSEIGGTEPGTERFGSRNLSLAFTNMEDAAMRAQLHIINGDK